jgi:hypothetical protein
VAEFAAIVGSQLLGVSGEPTDDVFAALLTDRLEDEEQAAPEGQDLGGRGRWSGVLFSFDQRHLEADDG